MTDLTADRPTSAQNTAFAVILAVSFCHMVNDIMQSLLAAIYPLLKESYQLDFWQIGLLTFTFQVTASLLQPVIGMYTDRRPLPYSLPWGMASSLVGLFVLAYAGHYWILLAGAALIGIGSAVFHPESSRVARLASGGRFGLAQSLFQVGGNFGQSLGPLLAAFIVVPFGQDSVAWFAALALLGIVVLWQVGALVCALPRQRREKDACQPDAAVAAPARDVRAADPDAADLQQERLYGQHLQLLHLLRHREIRRLGADLAGAAVPVSGAAALGILLGGPFGDRYGQKAMIWFSILGVLPFTLALPYANLEWTIVLTILIGLILSSAFSNIVVFAQELVPGRVGMIAGIFFGFAFGMAGIAAALLGVLADHKGIDYVYWVCSFLPLVGLLTVFLPADVARPRTA